jgi:hypothetical protein
MSRMFDRLGPGRESRSRGRGTRSRAIGSGWRLRPRTFVPLRRRARRLRRRSCPRMVHWVNHRQAPMVRRRSE